MSGSFILCKRNKYILICVPCLRRFLYHASNLNKELLFKLKVHGIGDGIINWVKKWQTDRRQRAVVEGEVSSWKSVLTGVPQGTEVCASLERLTMMVIKYINKTWEV